MNNMQRLAQPVSVKRSTVHATVMRHALCCYFWTYSLRADCSFNYCLPNSFNWNTHSDCQVVYLLPIWLWACVHSYTIKIWKGLFRAVIWSIKKKKKRQTKNKSGELQVSYTFKQEKEEEKSRNWVKSWQITPMLITSNFKNAPNL